MRSRNLFPPSTPTRNDTSPQRREEHVRQTCDLRNPVFGHHGGIAGACRAGVVAGRIWNPRSGGASPVRGHLAVDGGGILQCRDRLRHHALFSRSCGCSDTGGRTDPGQRTGDGIDCHSSVRSQRTTGPHHPKPRTDARWSRRFRICRALPPLPSERYQRCRFCGRGRSAVFRIDRTLARSDCNHLPKADGKYRFQGRQYPRILRELGKPPRVCGYARCRQLHAGRCRHPPRSHHAGRSQARHPSGSHRRVAVNEPVRPHLSVRHAARHALLHDRKRVVAVRLRSLLGAQRHPAARTVHQALPTSDVVRRRRG